MPEATPSLSDLTIDDDGNVVDPDVADVPDEPTPDATDSDDPTPDPSEPPDDDEDDDAEWLAETGEKLGLDLSKYKTREDAMSGLGNAAKKVGERDQYAQFGQELLAQYRGREQELEDILRGQAPAQAPPAAADTNDLPKTPEEAELLRSQIRTDDDGNVVAVKGAPANTVSRYERYSAELSKRLHLALFNTKGFLKDQAGLDPEAQSQQYQQQLQQTVYQREQQDWVDRHATDLWVDGDREKGLTPLGARAQKIWERHGSTQTPQAWQAAIDTATEGMPKATTRKPSQAARHRATTAPAAKSKDSNDAVMKAGSDKEAADLVIAALMRDSGYTEDT